jgi:UDP-glucose:(glucosyl)LPS alpha-1,2-glucosyltransferase
MTQIIDGVLEYNESTANANGGTELMARRMVRDLPPELLKGKQIIHSRVREIRSDLKTILVCHDLANDPEVSQLADPQYRAQFDKIVFVSNWQQHMYNLVLGVPFSESYVIPNGIEVGEYTHKPKDGPIRLIYHTTPHRGLALLAPAFIEASKHFDLHLDVFSSFEAYGWGERDVPYKPLFDQLESIPNVTVHGFQPNDVIREHLKSAHVFAYPSIWTETSCLAQIEAMSFGLHTLHSNLGALNETSIGLSTSYMYDEDINRHVNTFYRQLIALLYWIQHHRSDADNRSRWIAQTAQNVYDWNIIQRRWINLLETLGD